MSDSSWFDRNELDRWLREQGQTSFADLIAERSAQQIDQPTNGDLKRWISTFNELPSPDQFHLDLSDDRVRVLPTNENDDEAVNTTTASEAIREQLMCFHPWRKGPLEFAGHFIDTEWRSDWKYERIRSGVDFRNKKVLDVGCGNGYYGWRMLADGASFVLGFDPILRFLAQFEVFRRYAKPDCPHHVVPLIDENLPDKLNFFDVVVSAGVLYHRTSPIDHLRSLAGALAPGGQLVLETIVIEDDSPNVLVPEDRYAQMRNVWFLPSVPMIFRWLQRTGFTNPRLIDISTTTSEEQRTTDWMTFQSLRDFMDPNDPTKTVEGYPGPVRAIVVADCL
ncbi:tRNA 5-methoxyuridine(34)/uridine 5-oxyacetic acid(34) synthase CmoB [Rhodopirellula sp. MGV]|uniref:tRNA 5-methoxyuridine(34)/uridine 5-oxyacetic acid(34) synthase CmoB n=1 Tax=Rhodopirellula sp. MGV TaxID=2023130 RepID=UPI000B964ED8|nr:tRNA 5-methoxyuridine(34)/uridine 5-oxyacetic acid(34) synthase CmoB [Rhodopirellula sp. MGV]OYP28299.1 tRNA 5-methoxyuridine(34)/uridine 5-oxyacetic acid(34) synthase CmoB [Rhodopirellula sp. MGV]PNY38822.1 tRNA 5-methoxyuridine(34)/uridine 5-oxyacetic acid(34) synthase CmoB [Rhodopirellula baltica]